MSLLSENDLQDQLAREPLSDRLVVMPRLSGLPRQASLDLRLGTEFIEVVRSEEALLDPMGHPETDWVTTTEISVPLGEHLYLHPRQFMLGSTFEFVRMPLHLGGQVLGRSSWARLGLIVATAVVVQPGFAGCLTLEIVNMGSMPIRLYPGLRIAQLQVWELATPSATPYMEPDAKYKAPLGPQSSRIGWEAVELEKLRSVGKALQGLELKRPSRDQK